MQYEVHQDMEVLPRSSHADNESNTLHVNLVNIIADSLYMHEAGRRI
jgi:hypothetical protein